MRKIAIVGAGHAGIEAGLAAARMGVETCVFAINLDAIANMPCNPSIGGMAKGNLVREIDALGGEMGKVTDATFLQSRILGRGNGAAVHSLRAQADRRRYAEEMKRRLESQPKLSIIQAEIVKIDRTADSWRLTTRLGEIYNFSAVVLATGTFLSGKIIVGDISSDSGPDGLLAATELSSSLSGLGLELMRFKTGTPPRVHRRSIDFSKLEEQCGDAVITPFSFETGTENLENRVVCHLAYTNERTHEIIRRNLHLSPMYSGLIEGTGPRYCPSIEDKIVRFSDKARHQIFVEPMGMHTDEMYMQGLSTSLPPKVQREILHSMEGLEKAEIMRFAYAIEYDAVNPLELAPTLEYKKCAGLFGAGQINGTSGYEEAAAQGLLAGINAAQRVLGGEPLILGRDEAYIGVLIDDLTTKGTNEPYRMMTARAEFRLLLRHGNADGRLTPIGYKLGLIGQDRYEKFSCKQERIRGEISRLKATTISPGAANPMLKRVGSAEIATGARAAEILRRPEVKYADMAECVGGIISDRFEAEEVETSIKYEGYVSRQFDIAEQVKKLENKHIPQDIDYDAIQGLRIEARQKLSKVRPLTVGQATRISGVNPADIAVLLVYLK
ncbi:MAG: tRNA uridine-5-carboxymethylaminomethyl(34) synthesis enzyme MnmG [Clostridiales bacterium]|jgi:tRNA uridine 5-carboxymethylaminomethyl modification enzyme|nr:tRNA uridine-5-carboxymethylaminomethyl(34) synthesis enzyme MnmG [Clostridiales bacterium]